MSDSGAGGRAADRPVTQSADTVRGESSRRPVTDQRGAGAEAEARIRGQGVGIGDSGAGRRSYKEVLTAAVNRPNTRSVTRATARAAGGLDQA